MSSSRDIGHNTVVLASRGTARDSAPASRDNEFMTTNSLPHPSAALRYQRQKPNGAEFPSEGAAPWQEVETKAHGRQQRRRSLGEGTAGRCSPRVSRYRAATTTVRPAGVPRNVGSPRLVDAGGALERERAQARQRAERDERALVRDAVPLEVDQLERLVRRERARVADGVEGGIQLRQAGQRGRAVEV